MAMRRQNRPAAPAIAVADQAPEQVPADGEFFDLNVSSGSDDEDAGQPARQPPRRRNATVAEVDQVINDPTPAQDSKKGAADIRYFFDRQDDKHICKVCK